MKVKELVELLLKEDQEQDIEVYDTITGWYPVGRIGTDEDGKVLIIVET